MNTGSSNTLPSTSTSVSGSSSTTPIADSSTVALTTTVPIASSSSSSSSSPLECAKCKKRTSEDVSKTCHLYTCGLPLHASCSRQVAENECGLELGASVSSAFCSKKCYEMELLAISTSTSVTSSGFLTAFKTTKRILNVPNEITAALTVKIGDISRTSRKQLSLTTFLFLVSEGFEVFKAKANTRTMKEIKFHSAGENYIRDDMAIYIKPGMHSKQSELVELNESNFEDRITRSYRNFLKRKPGGAEIFECDILTYIRKKKDKRYHNNTSNSNNNINNKQGGIINHANMQIRQQLQLQQFQQQQLQNPKQFPIVIPPNFIDYTSTSDASGNSGTGSTGMEHLPGDIGPALGLGGTSTLSSNMIAQIDPSDAGSGSNPLKRKHQQTFVDPSDTTGQHNMMASNDGDFGHAFEYKNIRMILNGSVVSVKVNVRDLFSALGVTPQVATMMIPSSRSTSNQGTTIHTDTAPVGNDSHTSEILQQQEEIDSDEGDDDNGDAGLT